MRIVTSGTIALCKHADEYYARIVTGGIPDWFSVDATMTTMTMLHPSDNLESIFIKSNLGA